MTEEEYVQTKELISALIFDYEYEDPEMRPHEETCNDLGEQILNLVVLQLNIKTEIDLTDRWVIAFDTLCDGWRCIMDGEKNQPYLFETEKIAKDEIAKDPEFYDEGDYFVERADRYLHGRKSIFIDGGIRITGEKLDKYGRVEDDDD